MIAYFSFLAALVSPLIVSADVVNEIQPTTTSPASLALYNSPQCELEMVKFDGLNVLFRDDVDVDPYCIERNETPTSIDYFCDFAYLTELTQESCENTGGDLYNLKLEQECAEEIPDFGAYTINVLRVNAYVCLGMSCEVQNLLRKLEEETLRDTSNSCMVSLTAEWIQTQSTHI